MVIDYVINDVIMSNNDELYKYMFYNFLSNTVRLYNPLGTKFELNLSDC